jgi:hypothetical protein
MVVSFPDEKKKWFRNTLNQSQQSPMCLTLSSKNYFCPERKADAPKSERRLPQTDKMRAVAAVAALLLLLGEINAQSISPCKVRNKARAQLQLSPSLPPGPP